MAQVEALDAIKTLGTLITEEFKRDAVHIAVVPVIALSCLEPGEHVGIVNPPESESDLQRRDMVWVDRESKTLVGIIDPFLQHSVEPDQICWLFLYPRTITSLRHVWTHPEFSDEPVVSSVNPNVHESMKWLTDCAIDLDVTAETLIGYAKEFLQNGSYWRRDDFEGVVLDDIFWDHFEVVTGQKVPNQERGSFFACGC